MHKVHKAGKQIITSSSKASGENAERQVAPTTFTNTHPFRWRDTLSAVLGDVFLDPNFLHVRDIAEGRSIEIVIDLDFMKLVATFFSLLRSHGLRGHGLVSLRGLGLWCVGLIIKSIIVIVIVISFLLFPVGGLSLFLRVTFQVLFEHAFSILPALRRQVILRHTTQALLAMVPKSLVKSILQFARNKGVEMGAGVVPVAANRHPTQPLDHAENMRVDREDWQLEVECQNVTSRLYIYSSRLTSSSNFS